MCMLKNWHKNYLKKAHPISDGWLRGICIRRYPRTSCAGVKEKCVFKTILKFDDGVDVSKILKRINLPNLLRKCATYIKLLLSNIHTMVGPTTIPSMPD